MNTKEAETLAKKLMSKHCPEYRFGWDNAKQRFGCCHQREHLITLSKPITKLNDYDEVHNVILHEIAHAIAGAGHGHDALWKSICRKIGARPERCFTSASVATPTANYFYECPSCGKQYGTYRKRKRKGSCTICSGGIFNEKYLLKLIN